MTGLNYYLFCPFIDKIEIKICTHFVVSYVESTPLFVTSHMAIRTYLQLILVEDGEQVVGHEQREAAEEGVGLTPHSGPQAPLGEQIQVRHLATVAHLRTLQRFYHCSKIGLLL